MLTGVVLDSSAVVAWLLEERGWEHVDRVLAQANISAVVLTETLESVVCKGVDIDVGRAISSAVVQPIDRDQAIVAGALLAQHRRSGLSLGDACCIALAIRLDAEVFTADQAWARLELPVQVRLIR